MTTRVYVYPVTQDVSVLINDLTRFKVYCKKGDDCVIRFTFRNSAGTAQNVSAYTTRDYKLTGPATLTGTPGFVTDGSDGKITITLTDVQLAVAGTYAVEMQVSNGSSIKYTPVLGVLEVQDSYA